MSVRFLRQWDRYGVGEVATFSDGKEVELLKKGLAERVPTPPNRHIDGSEDDRPMTMAAKARLGDEPRDKQTTVGPQTRK